MFTKHMLFGKSISDGKKGKFPVWQLKTRRQTHALFVFMCFITHTLTKTNTHTNGKMRKIRMFCYETDDVKSLSYRLNSLINVCVQKSVFLRQTSWNHSLSEMDNSFQYTHIFMIRCFFRTKATLVKWRLPVYIPKFQQKQHKSMQHSYIYRVRLLVMCKKNHIIYVSSLSHSLRFSVQSIRESSAV